MKLPKQQAGVMSASRNIAEQQTASLLPSGTCGRFENWIRDSYGGANFTEACRNHDKCYDTCGKNKEHCDDVFKSEMHDVCNSAYSSRWHVVQRRLCKETANTYHSAVNRMGGDAYRAAQKASGC